jgi:hypothetical protein
MRRSTPLAALAATLLAAGACHNPRTVLVPAQPTSSPGANPPPTARRLEPMPPIASDLYGVYVLRQVAGGAIPGPADSVGGCAVNVVSGTLSLERGRFTWTETQQRTCGGSRDTRALRAAGGFSVSVASLTMSADSGAFATGVGTFLGHGQLEVRQLGGGAGAGAATRLYVKRDLVPPAQ